MRSGAVTELVCLSGLVALAWLSGCGGGGRSPAGMASRADGLVSVASQSIPLRDDAGRDTGRILTSPAVLVRPGQEFMLPVSVSDLSGTAGATIRLQYGAEVFQCLSAAVGDWAGPGARAVADAEHSAVAAVALSAQPRGPGAVATFRLRALASAVPQDAIVRPVAVLCDARGRTVGRGGRGAAAAVSPLADTGLIGDLLGSGKAEVGSAVRILRVVVGLDAPPPSANRWQWDCNKSGSVEIGDAITLLRCVVGLDTWPIFQITTKGGPDGGTMVWVPPGEFDMGSTVYPTDGTPVRHIRITKGFWIGKYAVTGAQYTTFINLYGHAIPGINFASYTNGNDNYPYINASYNDAAVYCQTYNMRLPTEAEWEYAARGTTGNLYPWGNTWDATKCCNGNNNGPEHTHYQHTLPVGSFASDTSWCGEMDVAGNAAQWCQDWLAAYDLSSLINPTGPISGTDKVIRGGCWSGSSDYSRLTHRNASTPRADVTLDWIGIRCVQPGP